MNRRSFLRLSALGGAALVFDPEMALWVPGQKTVFDLGPSPIQRIAHGDWMAQLVDRAIAQYDADMERYLFTRVNGRMFGGSIHATAAQRKSVAWPEIERQLTARAEKELDAAARHARSRDGYA